MGLLCKAEKLLHSRPCGRLGRRKKPRERGGAASLKIRHSITQKLVSIIAVLLTVSISAITGMVSVLVSADVGLTAEDNNFSINKRTAASTQIILSNIRSAARIFLINARENADSTFFFTENADIACVGITDGRNTPVIFRNEPFFLAHDLHENIIQNYLLESGDALDRAWAGESLMLNASPAFGTQLIALLFLIDRERVAFAFVSTEKLLKSFGQELNISFLINDDGDVLAHPDGKLVEGGANVSNIPYIQGLLENSGVNTNIQTRFVDSNGGEYISAYQKINFQGELDSGSAILITIIAVKTVFQGIVDTTRRNIILGLIALGFSILVIMLFSKTLTRPLKQLAQAAHQIEDGNYDLNLRIKNRDEIGVLTENFISMTYSLENFERFTNKALVRLARRGLLRRTGENKNATVCFAFIRDFGEMTEGLRARTVVEFVNNFLDRVVPCVSATGGVVDKFLTQGGVIVMALWGTAESSGSAADDALNCVRACLMMRIALLDLNEERFEQFWGRSPHIKMGCGINSGEVVAGQIGCEERMEYTVIGDTVNLAARLEGPNDLFDTDILISENTKNLIGDAVLTTEMPSIEVKGKEAPMRVFAVLNMANIVDAALLFEEYQKTRKAPEPPPSDDRRVVKEISIISSLDQLRKALKIQSEGRSLAG